MLLKHIRNFTSTNEPFDSDGWKHIPVPPRAFQKIVYVHGDLDVIVANAFRRNWVPRQGAKLGQPLCAVTSGQTQRRLYKRAVERQFRAFTSRHEILDVHYDELWHRIGELGNFLNVIDPAFVGTFPPKRARLTIVSKEASGPNAGSAN